MTAPESSTRVVCPFVVLGIAPTLDPGRVKQAYFAMLAESPPHTDPDGFQRIRAAYETLRGEGLHRAYLYAALDLHAEVDRLGELRAERDRAAKQARAAHGPSAKLEAFRDLLGMEFEAAMRRIEPTSG
ncbi:MAG: hypothetical protein AAGF11_08585 [Myxococcota bacterium]